MCTVAPTTYRHSISEVWYSPEAWRQPELVPQSAAKQKRDGVPPRPLGSGFESRIWDSLYGNTSTSTSTEQSRLEADIYTKFEQGETLRLVLTEVERLVPEADECSDSFDESAAPWDKANSAVLHKMYRKVRDTSKRNSFAQRKRRGSNILQSIFPLRKLSSQSIKKHLAKCSGPLFKLKHSDIKLQC